MSTKRILRGVLFLLGILAANLSVSNLWSGWKSEPVLTCGRENSARGSVGYCAGSILGSRNSPNNSDMALFYYSRNGANVVHTFSASVGFMNYVCVVSANSPLAPIWDELAVHTHTTAKFKVTWDPANFECLDISIETGSPYSNF